MNGGCWAPAGAATRSATAAQRAATPERTIPKLAVHRTEKMRPTAGPLDLAARLNARPRVCRRPSKGGKLVALRARSSCLGLDADELASRALVATHVGGGDGDHVAAGGQSAGVEAIWCELVEVVTWCPEVVVEPDDREVLITAARVDSPELVFGW